MAPQHFDQRNWRSIALLPVAGLFRLLVWLRRRYLQSKIKADRVVTVPIIVVGNITVGGTGKTPMVIELVKRLQREGYRPGIVSRGYRSSDNSQPKLVVPTSKVMDVGDEPLHLAQSTDVPVCICADRVAAVRLLEQETRVNVVVSDDGMQHYAMPRMAEIAVVDGLQGVGNGWMLPSGPLREPVDRLQSVQLVAVQGQASDAGFSREQTEKLLNIQLDNQVMVGSFALAEPNLQVLGQSPDIDLAGMKHRRVHAVAGLGNPARFFALLRQSGLDVIEHALPDHHDYNVDDILFADDLPVFMTSKDAVKIRALAGVESRLNRHYEVKVSAVVDFALDQALQLLIHSLHDRER